MGARSTFRHPRFEIIRDLGEGGMGRVHLARDLLSGREVALKVYPARSDHARLESEFLALRSLHHPSVARALHLGVSSLDGAPFLVLEKVPGEPLDRWLAARPPATRGAEALRLLVAAASAVAYFHRRGMLHLDLKPANILVVEPGAGLPPRPVIIDFGLVRSTTAPAKSLAHATLPYAAPEVLAGGAPTPASDVYSLAAAFFRAVAGRYPVEGPTPAAILRAHRRSPAATSFSIDPPALGGILQRSLAADPARRFRDGGELHQAAAQAVQRESPAAAAELVAFHEPDFVGRAAELEKLEAWIAAGKAQRPTFEVRGAPGWGKTRFLEKAQTVIEARKKTVVPLSVHGPGARPLLEGAFRALRLLGGRRRASGAPRNARSKSELDRALSADKLAPWARRLAAEILRQCSPGAIFVVDDVDLASAPERAVLQELGRAIARDPRGDNGILVSSGPPATHEATARTSDLLTEAVELPPLALAEALEIDLEGLDGALARHSPDRVRELKTKLHAECGGHPLFYVRGLLDLAGNGEESLRLAPTERVRNLLTGLSRDEVAWAAALAVLGRPATVEDVQALAGAHAGRSALERLRSRGLLAGDDGALRLAHPSLAATVLEGLSAAERCEIELGAAELMARRARTSSGALLESAGHFIDAGERTRGLTAALEWLEGPRDCPAHLREAGPSILRRCAETAAADEADTLREASSDLLERLGRFDECAEVRQGLVDGPADASRGSLARKRGGSEIHAVRRRRKLGAALHRSGKLDLAVTHLTTCVSAAAERADPIESLRARADLALLHHFRGEGDEAFRHSSLGITAWRASPRPLQEATVQSAVNFHAVLGQVHFRRLELGPAMQTLRAGLRLARRAGNPSNTALLLNNLGLSCHLAGRLDEALTLFREAESVARDLGDAAALVSIRTNVAQILARRGSFLAAQAALDELEEWPAARQSLRLRLHVLYSRGLLFHLLDREAGETWRAVETLAIEAGDAFLEAFARLYRSENLMATGELAAARALLERAVPAPAEASRWARLALLEARAGRVTETREARKRLDARDAGPPLLDTGNRLLSGEAALESGDLEEARVRLEDALRTLRSRRIVPGELEARLLLADLHLRSAAERPDAREEVAAARRELEAARSVSIEAPAGVSPRARDLRASLLEARCIVAERLLDLIRPEAQSSHARSQSAARADGELNRRATLRDLLARAAGDSALASRTDAKLALECLRAASARLDGDLEAADAAAGAVERIVRRSASESTAEAGPSSGVPDPWIRLGLGALRPLIPGEGLPPGGAEALCSIAALREESRTPDAVMAALQPCFAGGHLAWAPAGEAAAAPRLDGITALACAPARAGGAISGHLVVARAGGAFTVPEARLLGLAAALLPATDASANASLDAGGRAAQTDGAISGRAPRKGGGRHPSARDRTESLARPARGEDAAAHTRAAIEAAPGTPLLREEGIVASGREMRKVLRTAAAASASNLPVLITGESGTGKNLIARLIHRLGPRNEGPFIVESAAAVPEELFAADLFGYERGAFTGAERTRTGFLFQAAGGTFHLEEVGDLPANLQQRLLRVLDAKTVRPLGATHSRILDVRFVASTQKDLEEMVRRGEFRKDLYYRLNGLRIALPRLTQRFDEIEDLAAHHWLAITGRPARFTPAFLEELRGHDWPGNVRELFAALDRLRIESPGALSAETLRAAIGAQRPRGLFPEGLFESNGHEGVLRLVEEAYLRHLLARHGGRVDAIARELRTSPRSVYRKFERLGVKPKDLKSPG